MTEKTLSKLIQEYDIEDKKNLTFNDFIELVEDKPKLMLRNSAMYIKDMLDFYGKNDEDEYSVFLTDEPNSPPVYGQSNIQKVIYKSILNFINEGQNNKFLLLTGPNGSSKSSIVSKLMLGCEKYSLTQEGTLYTFSWIFPNSRSSKLIGTNNLGLLKESKGNSDSLAHLSEEDISAILPSELKDHPILLLPKEIRQKIIKDVYPKKELEKIKRTYIYNGDLSLKNKMIFDSLLQSYEGNLSEVLNHVRVEKYNLSKRYSKSLCTIEPQMHVDAQLQQITMDRRISNLPPSIEHLNLFNVKGPLISANRGILEYSDLLKRPVDTYKYLLMSIEHNTINLNGLLTELDILFIGSSNEIHLQILKQQNPDFNSFKTRFKFIHVPYLLNFKEEEKIYKNHVKRTNSKRFEPYALESLALFNICLRLFKPIGRNYERDTYNSLSQLSSIEKALIYAKKYNKLETANNKITKEQVQYLKSQERNLRKEYFNTDLYEGFLGISPREVKELIHEISYKKNNISFMDVIRFLSDLKNHRLYKQYKDAIVSKDKTQSFDDLDSIIEKIKYYYMTIFQEQATDSLNVIDEINYDKFVKQYLATLEAFYEKESILDPLTNKKEAVSDRKLKSFEDKMNISAFETKEFREKVIRDFVKLKDKSEEEVYKDTIYPRLKKEYNEKKETVLVDLLDKLNLYSMKQAGEEETKQIDSLLTTLEKKYGYSKECSLDLLSELRK